MNAQDFPRPLRFKTLLPAIFAALFALTLIPYDAQDHTGLYGFLKDRLGFLTEFFSTTRQLAATTGVLSILATIWALDPPRRRSLVVFAIALGFSSSANEIIKQMTGRARPQASVLMGKKERRKIEEYLQENPQSPVTLEKRDQWLGFKPNRPYFRSEYASFPSGHANTALVLLAFLWILYPRGKWIWLMLTFGCALARVRFRRHFPSDVFFGGALGWAMAHWVFSWRWPARLSEWLIPQSVVSDSRNTSPP